MFLERAKPAFLTTVLVFGRIIQLKETDIVGQSTFGMKGSKSNMNETKVDLQIMRTANVVKMLTQGRSLF